MSPVRCTALRALSGSYGKRLAGESFTTDSRTAEILMARGLVERYREPHPVADALTILLGTNGKAEVKMQQPSENKMSDVPDNKAMPKRPGWPKGKPRKPRND